METGHTTASGTLHASSQSAFQLSIALASSLSVPCRDIQTWEEYTSRESFQSVRTNRSTLESGRRSRCSVPAGFARPLDALHGAFALPRQGIFLWFEFVLLNRVFLSREPAIPGKLRGSGNEPHRHKRGNPNPPQRPTRRLPHPQPSPSRGGDRASGVGHPK